MSLLLASAVIGLVACRQPIESENVNAQLGQPFSIGVGGEAQLAESNVRVRFEDVTNDSRCPGDVQCVWAGNATLRLRITGDTNFVVDLNTISDPRRIQFGRYELRVENLLPYRKTSAPIERKDYRATLVVRGLASTGDFSLDEIGQIVRFAIDDLRGAPGSRSNN